MPQVVAVVVAVLVAVGVPTAAATFIATLVVNTAITLGLSAIAQALAPGMPKPGASQVPLKQSYASRRSAFGEVKIAGVYTLFEASANTIDLGGFGPIDFPAVAYQVMAMLDGRSQAFTRWYFHDDRLTLVPGTDGVHGPDGKKYEYGSGGDRCYFHTRLGLDTETPYDDIVSAIPAWTSDHRGDGVTSCGVICLQSKLKFQQEDFPNGLPQPSAAIKSQLLYDPRDEAQVQGDKSTYVYSDNPVLCLLAYLTDANGGMGLSYARRILPAIDFWKAAADDCDADEATSGQRAIVDVAATAGDLTVTLSNVTGLFVDTVIHFPAETAIVDSVAGDVVTLQAPLTFDEAQNVVVTWDATGSEKRYRCAGIYQHDNHPADVVNAILSSFDGWMGTRGDGALVVYSGRYYEPTVTFEDRHVISYSLRHFAVDETAINAYQVSFTDPDSEFTTTDAGEYTADADIAARGVKRLQPLDLSWCPSAPQAGRVAKRMLARSTQEVRGQLVTTLWGFKALGERYIRVQVAENAALNDIVVEVTGAARIDLAKLQISWDVVGASPTVDDGDPGGAITVPGVPTPRPISLPLEAPTITAVTPIYDDAANATPGARLQIDVGAPIAYDVQWLARWKTHAGSDWHEGAYTDIDDGAAVQLMTGFVAASGDVDVQVAYQTAGGTSPWSATTTTTIDAPASTLNTKDLVLSEDVANGKFVNIWSTGGAAKARLAGVADDTKPADGFVTTGGATGATVTVRPLGQVNDALTLLTPGAKQWLAAAGGVVDVRPTSGWLQLLGKAVSATEIFTEQRGGELL